MVATLTLSAAAQVPMPTPSGAVNDLAGQIARETFLPAFRDNQCGAGTSKAPHGWLLVPFLGIFNVIGFGMIGAGLAARAFTGVMGGLIFAVVPMIIVQAFTEGLVAWGVSAAAVPPADAGDGPLPPARTQSCGQRGRRLTRPLDHSITSMRAR